MRYRSLRNRVTRQIISAKHSYYTGRVRQLRKTDPGRWHREIRNLANLRNDDLTIHVEGIDPSSSKAIANEINNCLAGFSQNQTPINLQELPAYLPAPSNPPEIQPWETYKELRKILTTKAGGPDNLPARILKEFAYEFSVPVTNILNSSFKQGIVPFQWKQANVVPVPKVKPPTLQTLRPISLTPLLAKVAESFICKWVMNSISAKLDPRQFGNRKGISTTHCIIDIYHHLISGADTPNNFSTLVLTDFSKAFDSIDHKIAIKRLLEFGVCPSIVKWIVSFLSERMQRVRYKQVVSDWQTLSGGVPQGTKLGPVIFLICINSALESNYNRCWKYVDDLTLGENCLLNKESKMQFDLNQLNEWSMRNGFSLNPSKCQMLLVYFGRKMLPETSLSIASVQLPIVSRVKLLGITLQSNLKWDGHVTDIITRANRKLFMIRKLKTAGLTKEELVIVYKGYVRPVMEYATPAWHSSLTIAQSNQLELIQKRICRIILGSNYCTYKQALHLLDLDPLSERRENLCYKFVLKTYRSNKFPDWFPKTTRCHTMTLRSSRVFDMHQGSTNRFQNSPIPYLTTLLNKLLTK